MVKIFSIEIIIPHRVHVTQQKHSIFIYGPLGRNKLSLKKMDIRGIGAVQVKRLPHVVGKMSQEFAARSAHQPLLTDTRGWILRVRGGFEAHSPLALGRGQLAIGTKISLARPRLAIESAPSAKASASDPRFPSAARSRRGCALYNPDGKAPPVQRYRNLSNSLFSARVVRQLGPRHIRGSVQVAGAVFPSAPNLGPAVTVFRSLSLANRNLGRVTRCCNVLHRRAKKCNSLGSNEVAQTKKVTRAVLPRAPRQKHRRSNNASALPPRRDSIERPTTPGSIGARSAHSIICLSSSQSFLGLISAVVKNKLHGVFRGFLVYIRV